MNRSHLLVCLLFGLCFGKLAIATTADTVFDRVNRVFVVQSIQQAELLHAEQCIREIRIQEESLSELLKRHAATRNEIELVAINASIESHLESIRLITENYLPLNKEWIRFKSAYQQEWVLLKGTGFEYSCYILVASDGVKAIYEFYDGGLGRTEKPRADLGNETGSGQEIINPSL